MPSLFVHLAPNILADTSEKFLRPFREALSSMLLLRGDNDNGGGAPVSLSEGSAFPASGADVLVTKGRKDTNEEDLQRCGAKLRVVIVPYAGPPRELRELLQEKYPGIRLLNSHYNAAPTAEYALGLLLAASKMLVRADAVMRTNDWSPRGIPADPGLPPAPMPAVTLYGKRVCIVGFGSIGKRVASCCIALGMRVVATRRRVPDGQDFERVEMLGAEVHVYPSSALRVALRGCTALVVCCPATAETIGMVGEAELACLADPAILVNVGRGDVVDEDALFQALQAGSASGNNTKIVDDESSSAATDADGEPCAGKDAAPPPPPPPSSSSLPRLFAAGIDTWYNYPTDSTTRKCTPPGKIHDFARLPNVVLSPHRGGGIGLETSESGRWEDIKNLIASLVESGLRQDQPLVNEIDLRAGY